MRDAMTINDAGQETNLNSELNKEQRVRLNRLSFDRLQNNLTGFGNVLSDSQKKALRTVLSAYTQLASGEVKGRYAFPLPTGFGKTESVVAWIASLNELGYAHIGVVVCASKVEALCSLKRRLLNEGVPEAKIGLVHSYEYDAEISRDFINGKAELPSGYASEESTEGNDKRQFLLVTHQRVKGSNNIGQYTYLSQPRNLVVWDESLICTESFAFEDDQIEGAINALLPIRIGRTPLREEALGYLEKCLSTIKDEMKRQHELKETPRTIKFPSLSGYQIQQYKMSLGNGESADLLKDFLDITQEKCRVIVDIEQGGGVLTYNVVVPEELNSIVILDASHNIRELTKMDKTINAVDFGDNILSYENVTIHHLRYPSGRISMQKEFSQGKTDRKVSRELIEIIKSIHSSEGILIWVFKQKGSLDYRKILMSDFKDSGIDINEKIETSKGMRPRIVFLSWGNELGISEYSYCSNVIFCGVLHRSHMDLGSAICAQNKDLLTQINNWRIRNVRKSEIIHALYQAMSRGSCRVIEGETTKAMNVWLIHSQNIKSSLSKVMPNLRWEKYNAKFLKSKVEHKAEPIADIICEHLETLDRNIKSKSVYQIKKDLEMSDVHRNTFTKALKFAVEDSPWMIVDRSVYRAFEYFFDNQSNNL